MKQTQQLSCTSHEKTINNRTKTKQKTDKNMIPTHCPPIQTLTSMNHLSTFPPSPIIYSNNTMIMISLAQIRQSNGCRSLRKDDIFKLHLRSGAGPGVSIPCFLQGTGHIHWLHLPKKSSKKKQKIMKKDQTPNKSDQNLGLRKR